MLRNENLQPQKKRYHRLQTSKVGIKACRVENDPRLCSENLVHTPFIQPDINQPFQYQFFSFFISPDFIDNSGMVPLLPG